VKKGYRYILFDLDGTLTYSHPGIYNCMRYALQALGKPEPTEAQLKLCVGPPLTYSFSQIFSLPEEEVPLAVKKYRERYAEKGLFENSPIEGALKTLEVLSRAGYALAIATSKPRIFAERIADKFGFSPFLTAVAGSGTDGSLNTKADVILEALRLLNAPKEESLMVGDRKHDAEGARLCGLDFAGLDVGYAEKGELAAEHPNYLFASFDELVSFLTK
jgi:phosphoglycolate phosphatase